MLWCRYLSDLHAPGDPAWLCIYAQHKWILQLMQNCRDEFIGGQRGDKLTQARTCLSLLALHDVKSLYLVFPIKQLEDVMWVWRKLREEREPAASPLYQLSSCAPPSITTHPCLRPDCLFFHECMNKMKVREHWLWIWISGLDMLLHTHTYKLSFSLTHSFTDGLEQLTPIKLFLC